MECSSALLSYKDTGSFNQIVTDYVEGAADLGPFYEHPVSYEGIAAAIRNREIFPTDRQTIVEVLTEQYSKSMLIDPVVDANIRKLGDQKTFVITTAHQPNIFSGYLYFIYKIIHAIKLADDLKGKFPEYDFVPVYYMGSEDADLDELGKIWLSGEKLVWDTKQTGAVGRMNTKGLDKLVHRIEGELSVLPFGAELVSLLKEAYLQSPDIQTATFRLVHNLFASFGLVVLIADHPLLKRKMIQVFTDDLLQHKPSEIVNATTEQLAKKYKVQASPREINLFYLKDDIRNRIDKDGNDFVVVDTDLRFTRAELLQELELYPERFSPNVILRGLYQETILPGIAFIGGGGELAYWLELKNLFEHYKVPFPVQVLRNSFLLVEQKWEEKMNSLDLRVEDFFRSTQQLTDELVKRDSAAQVHLTNELRDTRAFYDHLRKVSGKIDKTLEVHVSALEKRMTKQLQELEKKLLRAERRKFGDQSRQIAAIRAALFPNDNLQERVENFMPYYARLGKTFFDTIYECSPVLEQKFVLLELKEKKVGFEV
ncbi:bacillithiol biosynthesis cysteine-adding enzyme BshC [Flavihumibacter solisilvae]|uniref:Putative cysteine ligase BshC n=1 Tax=Flavihumibacter solisilvae TaxID=1349421 RepID=A0A0C1IHK3_9BACT|nr:bacillithiol biosynthesis cysteine-adding enzyme BshC [Flavihumibacter solisilvae]KIC93680.1 hypothetical protein OI18_16105 [Flavihumibacter solisilvae]